MAYLRRMYAQVFSSLNLDQVVTHRLVHTEEPLFWILEVRIMTDDISFNNFIINKDIPRNHQYLVHDDQKNSHILSHTSNASESNPRNCCFR
mmetsp:Transcript_58395/g.68186  ORF Transcript_58395/g.68186 Transcript_58395/m.68186 type:complete len:92 (+) Transcript_58395:154-429(+)